MAKEGQSPIEKTILVINIAFYTYIVAYVVYNAIKVYRWKNRPFTGGIRLGSPYGKVVIPKNETYLTKGEFEAWKSSLRQDGINSK